MSSKNLASDDNADMGLFWGCWIALVATSFGFVTRGLTAGEWGAEFGLTDTQIGEILGAGLWPFAISIILFSLVIDKIGYRVAMLFGLACHLLSTAIILFADSYNTMYVGTFILALGCGTVEAYINPVVTTMFSNSKAKMLNVLHAGWPAGLVLGGLIAIGLGDVHWKVKIGLILIPTAIYAVMLLKKAFPVNERVAAGISYRDMLSEVGAVGALIAITMIVMEVGRLFEFSLLLIIGLIVGATAIYAFYSRSLGKPLFILMLLIMMPLATTELGVDGWITSLMSASMEDIGIAAGWVLVYTSAIMAILRFFFAGRLIDMLTPFGLLALCSVISAIGLYALAGASGAGMILVAATVYGVGKSFFWPTTLGIVAEQFPRGGALTLNSVAGVGMLAVGIVGSAFLGNIQDRAVSAEISAISPEVHTAYVSRTEQSVFGSYKALDMAAVAHASELDKAIIVEAQQIAPKKALTTAALLPIGMLVCYLILIAYFKSRGGYKAVDIDGD
ncbi:MAG: sugar MFS transporter [Pseudomonadales bacterium]